MGIAYNPRIVTDGLVLALDAGNTKSYPGSGTTWTDLSGQGNNGSLVNGVGYNSGNGGSLSFDKINDHISGTPINRLSTATFEIWFNTSSVSTNSGARQYLYTQQRNPPTLAQYTYQERQGVMIRGNVLQVQYFNGSNNANSLLGTTILSPNIWYCVSVVINGTDNKMFLNGVIEATNSAASSSVTVNQSFVGRRGDAQGNDYFGGKIAIVRDYNKALTASEIQQNFNATRSRFGI
jgi:hypothetical protein